METGKITDGLGIFTDFIKNASLFVLVILLAYPLGWFIHFFLCKFDQCGSSGLFVLDFSPVVAMLMAFPFCLSFIFTILGGGRKYFWIIGIFLVIFIALHFYEMFGFFIELMMPSLVVGWGLGFVIKKIFNKVIK